MKTSSPAAVVIAQNEASMSSVIKRSQGSAARLALLVSLLGLVATATAIEIRAGQTSAPGAKQGQKRNTLAALEVEEEEPAKWPNSAKLANASVASAPAQVVQASQDKEPEAQSQILLRPHRTNSRATNDADPARGNGLQMEPQIRLSSPSSKPARRSSEVAAAAAALVAIAATAEGQRGSHELAAEASQSVSLTPIRQQRRSVNVDGSSEEEEGAANTAQAISGGNGTRRETTNGRCKDRTVETTTGVTRTGAETGGECSGSSQASINIGIAGGVCGASSADSAQLARLLARYYRIDTAPTAGAGSSLADLPAATDAGSRLLELPRPSNVRVLIISWYPPILKLSWSLDELSASETSKLDFYEASGSANLNTSASSMETLDMELALGGGHIEHLASVAVVGANAPGRAEASGGGRRTTATSSANASANAKARANEQEEADEEEELLAELRRRRLLLQKSLSCFQVTYNIINSRFKVIEEYPPYLRSIMLERLAPATEYSLYVVAVYLGKYRLFSERVQFVSPTDNESRRFKENTYRPIHRYPDERRELSVGLAQARGEELTIVTIAVAFWLATIYMFFNKWGKIRMLEPYQPAYRDTSDETAAAAAFGSAHHHPSAHNLLPGTGPGSAGTGSGALAGIGAKMTSFCGGLGAASMAAAAPAAGAQTLDPQLASSSHKHSIGSTGTLNGSLVKVSGGGATPVGVAGGATSPQQQQSGQQQQLQQQQQFQLQQKLILAAAAAATAASDAAASRLSEPSGATIGGRRSSRSMLLLGNKRYGTFAEEFPLRRTHAELNDLFQSKAQMLAKATTLWSRQQQQLRQQQFRSRLQAASAGHPQHRLQHSTHLGASDLELLAAVQGQRSAASRWLRHRASPLQGAGPASSAQGATHLAQQLPLAQGVGLLAEVRAPQQLQRTLHEQQQQRSYETTTTMLGAKPIAAPSGRKDSAVAIAATTTASASADQRKRSPTGSRLEQFARAGTRLTSRTSQLLRYHRQSRAIDYTSSTCFARLGGRSLDQQQHQRKQATMRSGSLIGDHEPSLSVANLRTGDSEQLAPTIDCAIDDDNDDCDDAGGDYVDSVDDVNYSSEQGAACGNSSNKLRRLLFTRKTHQHHHIATSTSSSTLLQQNQEAAGAISSLPAQLVAIGREQVPTSLPPSHPQSSRINTSTSLDATDGRAATTTAARPVDSSSLLGLTSASGGDLSVASDRTLQSPCAVSISSTSLPSNIVPDSGDELAAPQHTHNRPVPIQVHPRQQAQPITATTTMAPTATTQDTSEVLGRDKRHSSGLIEHHILIEPPSPPNKRPELLSVTVDKGLSGHQHESDTRDDEQPDETREHLSAQEAATCEYERADSSSTNFGFGASGLRGNSFSGDQRRVSMNSQHQHLPRVRQLGESYQLLGSQAATSAAATAASTMLNRRRDSSPARHFGAARHAAEQVLLDQYNHHQRQQTTLHSSGRPLTSELLDSKSLAVRRRSQQQSKQGRPMLLETPPGASKDPCRQHGELPCNEPSCQLSPWHKSASTGADSRLASVSPLASTVLAQQQHPYQYLSAETVMQHRQRRRQLLLGSDSGGGVTTLGSDEQQPEICLELPASDEDDDRDLDQDAFAKLAQYQSQASAARLLREQSHRQSCQLCSHCLTCLAAEHQHQHQQLYQGGSSHQTVVCPCGLMLSDIQHQTVGGGQMVGEPNSMEQQFGAGTSSGSGGSGGRHRAHKLPPLCRRSAAVESSGEEQEQDGGQRPRVSSVFVASPYSRAHRDSFAMLRALSQKKSKSAEDVACLSSLVLKIWVRDRNPLLQSASQQQLSLSRRQSGGAQQQRQRQRPKSSLTVAHI